jgi:uncharacterized membrane protein
MIDHTKNQSASNLTINSVPAMHAWQWIVTGYRLFKENPVMWIILFLIYFLIMLPVSLIPVIGSVVSTLLAPVFAGGMMLGCRAVQQDQDLEINHLFACFKHNTSQLVSVGAIYMLSLLAVAVLLVLALDKETIELLVNGQHLSPEQASGMLLPILIALLFLMPILMAYWFAPVLVALNNVNALEAMKLSFAACLKNIWPFLLYGFIGSLAFMIGLMLIGLGVFVAIPMLLGMFIVVPVMMTSLYASYADIFDHYHLAQLAVPSEQE